MKNEEEKWAKELIKYLNLIENCDHAAQMIEYEKRIEVLKDRLKCVKIVYEDVSRVS